MMKIQTQVRNGKTYKIDYYVGITKNTKGDVIQNEKIEELIVVEHSTTEMLKIRRS
jgi:hypothetical protein